jgi:hypothetical protein
MCWLANLLPTVYERTPQNVYKFNPVAMSLAVVWPKLAMSHSLCYNHFVTPQ